MTSTTDTNNKQHYLIQLKPKTPKKEWYYQWINRLIEVVDLDDKHFTVSYTNNSKIKRQHVLNVTPIEIFNPERLGFIDPDKGKPYEGVTFHQYRYIDEWDVLYYVHLQRLNCYSLDPLNKNLWSLSVHKKNIDKSKSIKQNKSDIKFTKSIFSIDMKIDSHAFAEQFFNNIGGHETPIKFLTWLPVYEE